MTTQRPPSKGETTASPKAIPEPARPARTVPSTTAALPTKRPQTKSPHEQTPERPHKTPVHKIRSPVPPTSPPVQKPPRLAPATNGNHPPRKGGENDRRNPDRHIRLALPAMARGLLPTRTGAAARARVPLTPDERGRNQRLLLLTATP